MKKLLKTLVIIGLINIVYNIQMEIFTFGEIPLLDINLYPIYAICLLPILGFYLAYYSEYHKTGITISIVSALPVLFFFLIVIMNIIAFIIGYSQPID